MSERERRRHPYLLTMSTSSLVNNLSASDQGLQTRITLDQFMLTHRHFECKATLEVIIYKRISSYDQIHGKFTKVTYYFFTVSRLHLKQC